MPLNFFLDNSTNFSHFHSVSTLQNNTLMAQWWSNVHMSDKTWKPENMNVNPTFKILVILQQLLSLFILFMSIPHEFMFSFLEAMHHKLWWLLFAEAKMSLLPVPVSGKLLKIFWKTDKIIFQLLVFWIPGTTEIKKDKKRACFFLGFLD